MLKDIKGIFIDALDIQINEKDPILDQLVYFVQKFNEDGQGQDKLLQRVEKKFENKVLQNVASKIAIDQVELSTVIISLENTINNLIALFVKLNDTSNFIVEVKSKLNKIDSDLKTSAN